mmetsp:Transcript_22913/g.54758  ORF Transcript_22913/g.54758 Transcript_22913/m.54758 type:complete len:304 (+) Transcript_22913:1085-1996(+)
MGREHPARCNPPNDRGPVQHLRALEVLGLRGRRALELLRLLRVPLLGGRGTREIISCRVLKGVGLKVDRRGVLAGDSLARRAVDEHDLLHLDENLHLLDHDLLDLDFAHDLLLHDPFHDHFLDYRDLADDLFHDRHRNVHLLHHLKGHLHAHLPDNLVRHVPKHLLDHLDLPNDLHFLDHFVRNLFDDFEWDPHLHHHLPDHVPRHFLDDLDRHFADDFRGDLPNDLAHDLRRDLDIVHLVDDVLHEDLDLLRHHHLHHLVDVLDLPGSSAVEHRTFVGGVERLRAVARVIRVGARLGGCLVD